MAFLKAILMDRSLWSQGAVFVTRFHVLPSRELQTSRGGASKELNHPPKIQRRLLKTSSPCESRDCHAAADVSIAQAGPVRSAASRSAIDARQAATPFHF